MAESGEGGREEAERQYAAPSPPCPQSSDRSQDRPDSSLDNGRQELLFSVFDLLNIHTKTSDYSNITSQLNSESEVFCRNILIKDRKGVFYLVIVKEENCKIDMKKLKVTLGAHRNFSFATSEDLFELFKV
jgi:hypothetical protein